MIVSNAFSNLILMIIQLIITFVMTPVYVQFLGDYDYGVWEIAIVVFGYLGLLDLGMRQALIVYSSTSLARNETDEVRQLYSTSLVLFTVIGVVGAVGWLGWSNWFFDPVVNESGSGRYTTFAVLIAANFFLAIPGLVSLSLLEGDQQFRFRNLVQGGLAIGGAACAYFLMPVHDPLVVLASIAVIVALFRLVITEIALRSKGVIATGRRMSFEVRKVCELISFGAKSFMQGTALQLEAGLPIVLLGIVAGPASVIFFAIPNALLRHSQNVVRSVAEVFTPEFSRLNSLDDQDGVRDLFISGSRALLLVTALLLSGIAVIGSNFIDAWIDPKYGTSNSNIILLLVIYYGVSLINPLVVRYLTAINKHGLLAWVRWIKLVVLLSLIVPALHWRNVEGMLIAMILTESSMMPVLLIYTCRCLEIRVTTYLLKGLSPLIPPVLALFGAAHIVGSHYELTSLISVMAAAALLASVFIVAAFFISMNKEDRLRLAKLAGLGNIK